MGGGYLREGDQIWLLAKNDAEALIDDDSGEQLFLKR